jgi:hypothetical protein
MLLVGMCCWSVAWSTCACSALLAQHSATSILPPKATKRNTIRISLENNFSKDRNQAMKSSFIHHNYT